MAREQEFPKEPQDRQSWSRRALFPLAAIGASLSKVFINPFDVLLGFIILVIGLVELFGRHVSWGLYLLAILILIADLLERHVNILKSPK